jgi:hypothetical protein
VWFGQVQERLPKAYTDAFGKATDFREWADVHRVRLTCWFFGLPGSALRVPVDGQCESEIAQRPEDVPEQS